MIFTSFKFIIFFVVLFFLYFALPHRFKWGLLLGASYFFYATFKIEFLLLLIIPTIAAYFLALQMKRSCKTSRKKIVLFIGLLISLAGLLIFKYTNFVGESITAFLGLFIKNVHFKPFVFILPLGISFYTFKLVSYLVDVYHDRLEPEKHFGYFALYVSFFPQLLSGPIDRAKAFIPELKKKINFDYERVTSGLRLMLWGFFKKLVIADQLAGPVNQVFDHVQNYQGFPLIAAAIGFSFQIYCDFSGYSDIAIGISRVFGFVSMENFNSPYAAKSIVKFWNKWHISLSTWLRDYLFLPIAYAVTGKIKKDRLFNVKPETWAYVCGMFITMFLGGLWHGAKWTFVIWGALHGVYLIISYTTKKARKKFNRGTGLKRLPRLHKAIKIAITFVMVTFAWIFFRANSISDAYYFITHLHTGALDFAGETIKALFTGFNLTPLKDLVVNLGITMIDVRRLTIAILLLEFVQFMHRKGHITVRFRQKPIFLRWTAYLLILSIIIYWGKFNITEFIYFSF